jgi:acyl-CoA synthetase (AMP-forming)/AMP-acid ligase II
VTSDIPVDPFDAPQATTIPELIRFWAKRTPDAPAILAPGRPHLTYGGLLGQVETTIGALAGCGIGRADRVALALEEGPELAVGLLAVPSVAATTPFDPALTETELKVAFERLQPTVVLASVGGGTAAREVAGKQRIPVVDLVPGREAAGRFTLQHTFRVSSRASDPVAPRNTAYLLATSGTTGRPRLVPLSQANVLSSALSLRDAQELTAADRCLNLMRMYHISFIANLISSLAAGGSAVCPPGFVASQFFVWLEEFRPTWCMAPPASYRAVLNRAASHANVIARCPLRFIRTGAAPHSAAEAVRWEAAFGVPVAQGYGLTESSASMTTTPLPPGLRKLGSVGVSTGTEIEIRDEIGRPLPTGAVGEIVARGPSIFHGYIDDPVADAEAFTADGWFRTGDLGYLDGDGYLFLTGRLKELINRGGEKVSPGEVEQALLAHPAVRDAVAFAVPDERLGEVVGAAVVLREGHAATPPEVRGFVAERLAYHKVPHQIVILDVLPTGPTGKPRRIGLAQTLGLGPAPLPQAPTEEGFIPPRTPLEELIAGIWAEVLERERVGVADDFLALGGDSLLAAQVVARLRAALGLAISLSIFFETPTVAAMAAAIEQVILLHGVQHDAGCDASQVAVLYPTLRTCP